jgi:hypothetical protein
MIHDLGKVLRLAGSQGKIPSSKCSMVMSSKEAGEVIKESSWSSFWEYSTSSLIDEDGS